MSAPEPCIGIIANPASACDIRRIVAHAGNLQTAERASIVLRLLAAVRSCGVRRALLMPDRSGIRGLLERGLVREAGSLRRYPEVGFLDMEPEGSVNDTLRAAALLREARVAAIVVLGGDGTHRAVVRACADVPIVGLSTGTNNAFPELREPTLAGMALGLYASGKLDAGQALRRNKLLEISIDEGARGDIALVDAVISHERSIGARALWRPESLAAAYLSFAEPQALGLSAIGGLLQPVGRHEPRGLAVALDAAPARCRLRLLAPIAPGLIEPVGIAGWEPMQPDEPFRVTQRAGTVALDGERELAFEPGERVTVTLRTDAFPTLDVPRCLQTAARLGLFRLSAPSMPTH